MVRHTLAFTYTALVAAASLSTALAAAAPPPLRPAHIPRRNIRRLDRPPKLAKRHSDCTELDGAASTSRAEATNSAPVFPILQAVPTATVEDTSTAAYGSSVTPSVEASGGTRLSSVPDSTTVYVDVTVTQYIDLPVSTATSTANGTRAYGTAPASPADETASNGDNTISADGPASSASGTTTSTSSPTPTPSVPALIATQNNGAASCPPGSTFTTFVDDFANFDQSKWTFEAGDFNATTFSSDGGVSMELREDMQNLVFQSTKQWLPPLTMSVTVKSTEAPQIVSCVIFKNPGNQSDEIDLELIEGTWQVPIWRNAERLEFGRDVTGKLARSSQNLTSWVYQDSDIVPFADFNEYTVDWTDSSVTWSINGKDTLDVKKLESTKLWPSTQPLHVRFGPWVAGEWAGIADWQKFPNPTQQIKKISVEGCMLD